MKVIGADPSLLGTFRGRPLVELAGDALAIAEGGLQRRAIPGFVDPDESGFLATLREIVTSGTSPSDEMLGRFENERNGDADRACSEYAY